MQVIYQLETAVEMYRQRKQCLHMVFIDFVKTNVPTVEY